jgi:hypothetical protein
MTDRIEATAAMTPHDTASPDHPSPFTHHPPGASVWPMVIAGGLTLALFGLVVWTLAYSAVGIVLLLAGVVGWVRDLLADGGDLTVHEEHREEHVHERR